MFKVYNMVVWLSTSWDVDDFDRPCNEMLPSYLSGSRYISLPHLHSEVLDSSTGRVTRWPSVLGWVICPLWILLSYLSQICSALPHGDAELIKWDNGVRMLWTGKITEAKWKKELKKSSQDWPKQMKVRCFTISFPAFFYLLWPFFFSHTFMAVNREVFFLGVDIMIMDQRQLRFIKLGSKGET